MKGHKLGLAAFATFALLLAGHLPAGAADHHYTFGYDQPHTTGFGVAGDLFDARLTELSHGTMARSTSSPAPSSGQEPQMLQKIRTGDIDFMPSAPPPTAATALARKRRDVRCTIMFRD